MRVLTSTLLGSARKLPYFTLASTGALLKLAEGTLLLCLQVFIIKHFRI